VKKANETCKRTVQIAYSVKREGNNLTVAGEKNSIKYRYKTTNIIMICKIHVANRSLILVCCQFWVPSADRVHLNRRRVYPWPSSFLPDSHNHCCTLMNSSPYASCNLYNYLYIRKASKAEVFYSSNYSIMENIECITENISMPQYFQMKIVIFFI
jgi:hypothetical protein